jgi:hypothetical protein
MEIDNISLKKHFSDFNTCFLLKAIEGVGFDKPQLGDKGPTCGCASMTSLDIQDLQEQWLGRIRKRNRLYIFIE